MTESESRAKNRAKFPFAANIMDELREVFGDGVALNYAAENGHVVGRNWVDRMAQMPRKWSGG